MQNKKLALDELNRDTIEAFKAKEKNKVIVVLDNIRSAANVGSVFRTADAFNIEEVILLGITPCPPNRDITKTAIGATKSVKWQHFESYDDFLTYWDTKKYKLYSLEQTVNSIKLDKLNIENKTGCFLILGNEVLGVDQFLVDKSEACLEIPQYGTKHSLNVSVSAGIAIWTLIHC